MPFLIKIDIRKNHAESLDLSHFDFILVVLHICVDTTEDIQTLPGHYKGHSYTTRTLQGTFRHYQDTTGDIQTLPRHYRGHS